MSSSEAPDDRYGKAAPMRQFMVKLDFRHDVVEDPHHPLLISIRTGSATAIVQHDSALDSQEMLVRLHKDRPGFVITGISVKELPFRPGCYGIMEIG